MQCSMKNLAGMRAGSYQSFNCNIQEIQQKVSKTRKEFIDSHDQYSQPVCHLSVYCLSAPNSPFNICPVITISFRVSPLRETYVKCPQWRALEGLCGGRSSPALLSCCLLSQLRRSRTCGESLPCHAPEMRSFSHLAAWQ